MKIAFVTNLRTPYRYLQMNEFSLIEDSEITVYYTNKPNENRTWNVNNGEFFKEFDLKGINILKKYGYINIGLINLIRNNDIIILGGYEKPTYILISILCKILKKSYILFFDGISTNRLIEKENKLKKILKSLVIKNASYIMANGEVGRRYFIEKFSIDSHKIYNQYLAVDNSKIRNLAKDKGKYRKYYREKWNISEEEKVVLYSGRLIDVKNVEMVVRALSKIKNKDIALFITGGGELEEKIKKLANKLDIKVIITGFIENQEELFKHYFIADVFILPSKVEPWGLVVNEVMNVGLPVLVSNICGCSLDLVKDNGFVINPNDIFDIKEKLEKIFYEVDSVYMGKRSKEIINEWTFENSKNQFLEILDNLMKK